MSNQSLWEVNDFIRYHHNPIVAQKNEEIAHLQKLCEEQKVEIERLKNSVPGSVKSYIAQIEHLNRKVEALEWVIGEWKKGRVLWRERESNLNSEVDRQTEKLCYENAALQSQLATQTERVRVMAEALRKINEHCNDPSCGSWSTHALNQESLGDGGKGE